MLIVENIPIHNLIGPMSDDEFYLFCRANADLRIERDSEQNIIIMSPAGGDSSFQELEIDYHVKHWTKQSQLGIAFSPSIGFILPNGAMRSPDASWLSIEKWQAISPEKRKKFLPTVPEFAVEIRSNSDRMSALKEKCNEWIENGVQLLWLIDPKSETTWIYRADGSIEKIKGFDKTLSGEDVLPDFKFELKLLYSPE